MSDLDPTPSPGETTVSRRRVLRYGTAGAVAAWSVPVILTLSASPAGAASAPPGNTPPGNTPNQPNDTPPVDENPPEPFSPPNDDGTPPGNTPNGPNDTPPVVEPRTVVNPPPTDAQVRAEQVQDDEPTATGTTPSGGLAFTGAEIGGLVVLGTGAVALGTAAVWSARHRDDDDDTAPAG